jgi:hypothetical protein
MPPPARKRITENLWFWLYLFGVAGLVSLFLIGQKADRVQAQRDANFTRRQHSLELQADKSQQSKSEAPPPDADATDAAARYVDFTPFYLLIGMPTAVAWFMLYRTHFARSVSVGQDAS